MNRMLDYAALAITIVGAVNWGLIGFFELDLVAWFQVRKAEALGHE